MEGDLTGMGFAIGGNHLHAVALRESCGIRGDPALTDARRSLDADDAALSLDGVIESPLEYGHFSLSADECCQSPPRSTAIADGQQLARGDGLGRALDSDHLRVAQLCGVIHQPRRGLAEHHSTRGCGRLHPLRHPDVLADCRVLDGIPSAVPGDHHSGVETDPQLQRDAVTALHLRGQRQNLGLDVQRGQARAKSMVFQRFRGAEERHDSIAGELVQGATVAPDDGGRAGDHVAHQFAKALGAERGSDVH